MAVSPCQKPSDLSGPWLLLTGNLKVPFLASLCQRLQGALLPRVAGWVAAAAEEWLVSFTSSGGTPSSLFCQFLPEGLKSSEPSDILKCAPPVAIPQICSCSLRLHLLTPLQCVYNWPSQTCVYKHNAPFLVFSSPLLLWLFCSDLWEMDSTHIIGCLAMFSMI